MEVKYYRLKLLIVCGLTLRVPILSPSPPTDHGAARRLPTPRGIPEVETMAPSEPFN